jgi:two-component system NtrC family sensor kinase
MASIGQLAAGVAHEINNPMGFIISNLTSLGRYMEKVTAYLDASEHHFATCDTSIGDLLLQDRKKFKIDQIRTDLPELIRESQEGAERVRRIVQDLKSFSRIDSASHGYFDLNDGLESTLSIVWNELKYKTTVNKEYGKLPQVWCNLGQLNQVFMNLLVNAAQAIETQGEILIRTWAEAEEVGIAISDTGNGIPAETLSHVFDPFFTTKEVGKGTGLGLAIAYDIVVNKHGGSIGVKSQVGEGTCFTIMLPVKQVDESNHDK